MSELVGKNHNGIVCGIISKKTIPINFDRNDGIQVTKYFYKKFVNLKSAEECLNNCVKEEISCNVATFSKGSKICYLFESINSEQVINYDYISYMRKSQTGKHCNYCNKNIEIFFFLEKVPNFERMDDLQITKYFYHSVITETAIKCALTCEAQKSCNISTYDLTSKICYLFQDINSTRAKNSNYVSFKKISAKT